MFISKTDMIAWIMYASLVNDLVFVRYRRLKAIVIVEITKSQCLSIYKIQNGPALVWLIIVY